MTPVFLTLDEAFAIHADQIERYGGDPGLRDEGLLRSALAQPEATFGGERLHTTLSEMAGAYLFHLVKNHPFVDGNKRTGLVCALHFLFLNGRTIDADADELADVVLAVAEGNRNKDSLTAWIDGHLSSAVW
jgi:death-on-curing protein